MINDKCPMINDSGYALIAVTFIMVSFLSMVFLLFYPLVREAREDSGFYIIDRNDYRYRKALCGEAVDQCGTKLAHCGGLYGDYISRGKTGTSGWLHHTRVTARLHGSILYFKNFASALKEQNIEIPQEYQFTEDHFWAGYWGKRYLHILPSDKWGYDTFYAEMGERGGYAPFLQPYAAVRMVTACGTTSKKGIGYSNLAKNAVVKTKCCEMRFTAPKELIVELKDYDYSENRNSHQLRLVLTGSKNDSENMFFDLESGYPVIYQDYRLYVFKQELDENKLAANTGQKKLMIQVNDNPNNPDSPWITKDTDLISLPVSEGAMRSLIFRVNFYG